MRYTSKGCSVYGIDIGKTVFHAVGTNSFGMPIQKAKFRRDTLLRFFQQAKPALVAMEACPGSQWLARTVRQFGHEVRIIPL